MQRAKQIPRSEAMLFSDWDKKATQPWCRNRCSVGAGLCQDGGLWAPGLLLRSLWLPGCTLATRWAVTSSAWRCSQWNGLEKLTRSEKTTNKQTNHWKGESPTQQGPLPSREFVCCSFCFYVLSDKPFLSFQRKGRDKLPFLYQWRCQAARDPNTFSRIKERKQSKLAHGKKSCKTPWEQNLPWREAGGVFPCLKTWGE